MRSVATAIERLRKHPELLESGAGPAPAPPPGPRGRRRLPIIDGLEDRVEELEDEVFQRPTDRLLERIFAARKEAAALRRSLGPLREVLSNLVSGVPYVDDNCRPFFRDVHDHVFRLLDEIDTNRDVLGGLLESYLSQVSNRMNAVMKRLTALAMIGLPFTVISGYFGMNFEVMPWLKQPWGIAAATILMFGLSTGRSSSSGAGTGCERPAGRGGAASAPWRPRAGPRNRPRLRPSGICRGTGR